MEGIDTYTVVGIAVLPSVCDIRIVDRQDLDDPLRGLVGPVDHHLQVAEVTDTETTLASQREHRNHRTGTLPRIDREVGLWQFINQHLVAAKLYQLYAAILSLFPDGGDIRIIILYDELELKTVGRQEGGIKTDYPLVILMLCHSNSFLRIPCTKYLWFTNDGQLLTGAQLWCTHLQPHRTLEFRLGAQLALCGSHTLCECRTIEIGILGNVDPVVINGVARSLLGGKLQTMGFHQPLVTHRVIATLHTIIIIHVGLSLHSLVQLTGPVQTVERTHFVLRYLRSITFCQDIQYQVFSEGCLIFQIKP